MQWKEAKQQLLNNKSIKAEYEKIDLRYEIGKLISDGRIARGITQERLAQIIGTKQPAIARLENGKSLPSFGFLEKIAKAFNTQLLPPRFQFLEQERLPVAFNFQINKYYELDYYWVLSRSKNESFSQSYELTEQGRIGMGVTV